MSKANIREKYPLLHLLKLLDVNIYTKNTKLRLNYKPNPEKLPANPLNFKNSMVKLTEQNALFKGLHLFQGYDPEDAGEYMSKLLENMEVEYNKIMKVLEEDNNLVQDYYLVRTVANMDCNGRGCANSRKN